MQPQQYGQYTDWANQQMKQGFTPEQVQQSFSDYNIAPSQNQTPSKGNWLTRLLPTAGGILGGIAGAAVPVLGETGVSEVAGASAGGALGQKLENLLTGTTGSTAAAGVENAIGGAVGKVGGGALKAGLNKVVAPLAQKGSTALVAGQAPGVTKNLATYLKETHGFTDLNKAGQMGELLTGSGEAGAGKALINKTVENNVLKNAPQQVGISDLIQAPLIGKGANVAKAAASEGDNLLNRFITENGLEDTQANAIRSKLGSFSNSLQQDINGNVNPLDALKYQRKASNLASEKFQEYIDSGRSNSTALSMAKTYNSLSTELKDRIFSPGGQDIALNPADKISLINDVKKYGNKINPKSVAALEQEINGATSLRDLRSIQDNWVELSQALTKRADLANKNFGTSTSDLIKAALPTTAAVAGTGGRKGIAGAATGLITSSPGADKAGASLLSKIEAGAKSPIAQKILPRAIMASSIGAANLPNIAESTGQGSSQQGAGGGMMGAGPTGMGQQSGQTGMQPQNPLADVYNTLMQAPGLYADQLSQLAPILQKQQMAQGIVGNLGAAYQGAGGAQGLGGGLLSQLSALVPGTPANLYQRQQQAASASLAKLLGIDPEQAAQLTPTLTQNPQSAAVSQANLQNLVATLGM